MGKVTKGLKISSMHIGVNVEKIIKIGAIQVVVCIYTNIGKHRSNSTKSQDDTGFKFKKGDLYFEVQDHCIDEIKYSGVTIKDYKNINKFMEFHKEMGIDISSIVNDEVFGDSLTLDDVMALTNITKNMIS